MNSSSSLRLLPAIALPLLPVLPIPPVLPGGAQGAPVGAMLGLLAAVAWGISDFTARGVSRASSPVAALFGSSLISTCVLSLGLPFGGLADLEHHLSVFAVAVTAGITVLYTLGNLALYCAFLWGPLALVSPICSSCTAVAAALAILTGERVGNWTLAGIILIFLGVVLVTATRGRSRPISHTQFRLLPSPLAQRTVFHGLSEEPVEDSEESAAVHTALAGYGERAPGSSSRPLTLRPQQSQWRSAPNERREHWGSSRGATSVVVIPPKGTRDDFPLRLGSAPPPSSYRRRFGFLVCRDTTVGIIAAVCAAVLLGASLWILRFVPTSLGVATTSWLQRGLSSVLLGIVLVSRTRRSLRPIWRRPPAPWRSAHQWLPLVLVGGLDACALTSYLSGIRTAASPLVAATASLDAVVVVTLALLLLRERLSRQQVVGVAFTLTGLLLVGIGS